MPVAEFTGAGARRPAHRSARGGFDIDDEEYAEIVRRIISDEIGEGEGANFVIRRSFVVAIDGLVAAHGAWWCFRRLLHREAGAYWTFVVHTGERTFFGATPERHVSLRDGERGDEPDQRHLPLPGRPDRPSPASWSSSPTARRPTSSTWSSTRSSR